VIAVNLTAPERITDELLEQGLVRPNGRIIGVASIAGIAGNLGQTNYGASKAGVIGLVDALADDLEDGITVNAVAPGFIETEMLETVPEKVLDGIRGQVPLSRLGRADEIARGVAFLCDENGGFVTGSTLSINGGQHMY
jgi:NAD(P)-dependent dehydrogenase (short-subunit alcohol dehydrogenase family)